MVYTRLAQPLAAGKVIVDPAPANTVKCDDDKVSDPAAATVVTGTPNEPLISKMLLGVLVPIPTFWAATPKVIVLSTNSTSKYFISRLVD